MNMSESLDELLRDIELDAWRELGRQRETERGK